jgi:hypothetical protein
MINVNLDHFYSKVKGIDQSNKTFPCIVHAARSRAGKIMTFHVHLEDHGAHYSLVPLHKLLHKEVKEPLAPNQLQPWDCFSDSVEAIKYKYFEFKKVWILSLKMWGEYILTFDWLENSYSDYTIEFKQGHLIKLENGQYGIYPNNFLIFYDKTYTSPDLENLPLLERQAPEDYITVENL